MMLPAASAACLIEFIESPFRSFPLKTHSNLNARPPAWRVRMQSPENIGNTWPLVTATPQSRRAPPGSKLRAGP
jgi:hypothetical protein